MPRRLNSSVRLALFCTSFIHLRCHLVKNKPVVLPNEPLANTLCPSLNENSSVDEKFPVGFPQNLTFGKFRDQTGYPFITQDFWADIVDNRRTFFLRPNDQGFPPMELLRKWIRTRTHPITLVLNNNQDQSWPKKLHDKNNELLLEEDNLHQIFAGNARNFSNKKLKPIPIGLKWQWRSTLLFGEEKTSLFRKYTEVSVSGNESRMLFSMPNRSNSVWVRPMMNSNKRTLNYERNTGALRTTRVDIPGILKKSAPLSLVAKKRDYFTALKENRFVVSPAGNGLDTHATWEALLAGCIPIVPKSPLDSLFEDLPVWLIDSWSDVTDASVKRMSDKFKKGHYNWDKLFAPWWKEEIHKGLCHF